MLERGSIVEAGDHSSLLAKRGRYHSMWERQQQTQLETAAASGSEDDTAKG